jgi:hypothetical protein
MMILYIALRRASLYVKIISLCHSNFTPDDKDIKVFPPVFLWGWGDSKISQYEERNAYAPDVFCTPESPTNRTFDVISVLTGYEILCAPITATWALATRLFMSLYSKIHVFVEVTMRRSSRRFDGIVILRYVGNY